MKLALGPGTFTAADGVDEVVGLALVVGPSLVVDEGGKVVGAEVVHEDVGKPALVPDAPSDVDGGDGDVDVELASGPELPVPPTESFRAWWQRTGGGHE